jgi:putative effector of murein hydrolase
MPDFDPVTRTMEDMVEVVEEVLIDEGVVIVELLEEEAVAVAVDLFERRLALRKKFSSLIVIDD